MNTILRRINYLFFIFFLFSMSECKKNIEISDDISLEKKTDLKAEEIKKNLNIGVVNVNRLKFRADNDLHSKTLRYLDQGTIVNIISKDTNRVRIAEIEDYWYQIEYEGITGWVFGYYLDIYLNYEDAKSGAKKYLQSDNTVSNNEQPIYYDDTIDKNLFFLSNGRILQVTNVRDGTAKKLETQSGLSVVNYFVVKSNTDIIYIGKQQNNLYDNGYLYYLNIETGSNILLLKDVYTAEINNEKNSLLILSLQKTLKGKYWIIRMLNLENRQDFKEIAKIKQSRDSESIDDDIFLMTMYREQGSLVYLKLDDKGSFVYFKPPEENLTYIISIYNGESIQIQYQPSNFFEIDISQYIYVRSEEDAVSKELKYSIMLKDKLSGLEKEIISSNFYPINFSLSPRKNLLAISMLDINKVEGAYYTSSIYVLSLITYSLIAISTEGKSYQPKWSNTIL